MVALALLGFLLLPEKCGSKSETIKLSDGPVYRITASTKRSLAKSCQVKIERLGGDPADDYPLNSVFPSGVLKW
jgi:hypothetical protein